MAFFFPDRTRPDPWGNVVSFSIQASRKQGGGIRVLFLIGRTVMKEMGWAEGDRVEAGYGTPGSAESGFVQIRRSTGSKQGYRLRPSRAGVTNGQFQSGFLPDWIATTAHVAAKCTWRRSAAPGAIEVKLPAWAFKKTYEASPADRPPAAEARPATADPQSTAQAGGSDSPVVPGAPPAVNSSSGETSCPQREPASERMGEQQRDTMGVTAGETASYSRGESSAECVTDALPRSDLVDGSQGSGDLAVEAKGEAGNDPSEQTAQPLAGEGDASPSPAVVIDHDRGSPDGDGPPKPSTSQPPPITKEHGSEISAISGDAPRRIEDGAAGGETSANALEATTSIASPEPTEGSTAGSEPARGHPIANARAGVAAPVSQQPIRSWSEDLFELNKLFKAGKTNAAIAAALGRSEGAVAVKLSSLGWRRPAVHLAPKSVAQKPVSDAKFAGSKTSRCTNSACGKLFVPDAHSKTCSTACAEAIRPAGSGVACSIDQIISYLRSSDRAAVIKVGPNYFLGGDGPLTAADLVEIANKRRNLARLALFTLAAMEKTA